MKLSRTLWYALQAIVYIAQQNKANPQSIIIGHKAAGVLKIPEGFLLRILVALSRARLLQSVKGPNGGYRLAQPPKAISLLNLIEAVEGPVNGAIMPDAKPTPLSKKVEAVFDQTRDQVRRTLEKTKIADLM